jgi:hypothetical protein
MFCFLSYGKNIEHVSQSTKLGLYRELRPSIRKHETRNVVIHCYDEFYFRFKWFCSQHVRNSNTVKCKPNLNMYIGWLITSLLNNIITDKRRESDRFFDQWTILVSTARIIHSEKHKLLTNEKKELVDNQKSISHKHRLEQFQSGQTANSLKPVSYYTRHTSFIPSFIISSPFTLILIYFSFLYIYFIFLPLYFVPPPPPPLIISLPIYSVSRDALMAMTSVL